MGCSGDARRATEGSEETAGDRHAQTAQEGGPEEEGHPGRPLPLPKDTQESQLYVSYQEGKKKIGVQGLLEWQPQGHPLTPA